MRLREHERLDMPTAERRALAALDRTPRNAAQIADHIWPGHSMTRQGAGAAASRVLVRLREKGQARWVRDEFWWGWIATARGAAGGQDG